MLRYAALTLISFLAVTTAASAQYYPAQNNNQTQPRNSYFCPQHNTYCNHSQAQYGPPAYNTQKTGAVPPGYYFCQSHNQYCNHAPLNDPRYTNGNNQGYYNNNGQYQGGQYNNNGQYNNGQYQDPRYNNNNNNNGQYTNNNTNRGHRGYRGNRTNNSLRNQTPPAGHYYCETHDSFCSH